MSLVDYILLFGLSFIIIFICVLTLSLIGQLAEWLSGNVKKKLKK